MRQAHSRLAVLVSLSTLAACVGPMPPPPELRVTSPRRGMVQGGAGQVTVTGTALPGADGAPIARVKVNGVPATLAGNGAFTATVDLPPGATLLETVAISEEGGSTTDARAVQVGQLRPVGTTIERAVTATLSADAFEKLSAAAGPLVKGMDLTQKLAAVGPVANLGDNIANLKLSITQLALGDARFTLTPVDGGLAFTAELSGLAVGAKAAYGGTLVPDGTTSVSVNADTITIGGTLVVTPAGTAGFTTKITSPTVRSTNLRLGASGLTGQILTLLDDNLGSAVQSITTKAAEQAMDPLINAALGALAGPQRLDVLGKTLDIEASPSAIAFTSAGALVSMNLSAKLLGSETSPGYVFTPNGTPAMAVGNGIQLGIADDLMNELLAEVHALGLLDIHLTEDVGLFDTEDIKLSLPPMVSASSADGKMRLVLGDMIATFKKQQKPVISAAINAQVELAITRGRSAQEIALQFGKVHLFVNVLDPNGPDDGTADDISGAATTSIGLQLDSLSQFLIEVPVPSVAGVSLDNLALRADSGYVVVSGQVH